MARHDKAPLHRSKITYSSHNLSELIRRVPVARLIEGAAVGVALWCVLLAFQLLPGKAADTQGVLLFLVAGMAIRVTPFGHGLIVILVLAAAMVVVVTETSISSAVASRWVRDDPFPDSGVAAIVVLSAALNPDSTISAEALDHLITGLELIRAGKAPVLVTTAVEQWFPTGLISSELDQSRIIGLFGGETRWIRTPPGKSTRDEAIASSKLLLPPGIRQVAVVASPMHTRRACSAFEAVGFVVTCVPARSRSPGGLDPGRPADRLRVFGDWVYEVAATLRYKAKGWLGARARRTLLQPRDTAGAEQPVSRLKPMDRYLTTQSAQTTCGSL